MFVHRTCVCLRASVTTEIVKRCTKIWLMMMDESKQGRCTVHSFRFVYDVHVYRYSLKLTVLFLFVASPVSTTPSKPVTIRWQNCCHFFRDYFVISVWSSENCCIIGFVMVVWALASDIIVLYSVRTRFAHLSRTLYCFKFYPTPPVYDGDSPCIGRIK